MSSLDASAMLTPRGEGSLGSSERGQLPRGLRQRPELVVESDRSRDKDYIIGNGPTDAEHAVRSLSGAHLGIFFASDDPWSNGDRTLNPSPQPGKPAPVAEGVDQDDGRQRARPEVQEGREPAEHGGVAELEDGAQQRGHHGSVRVRGPELVEMVDVGNAKVQRRDEDDPAGRHLREQMQRDDDRDRKSVV